VRERGSLSRAVMTALCVALLVLAPLVSGGREVWRSGIVTMAIAVIAVAWVHSVLEGRVGRPRLTSLDYALCLYLLLVLLATHRSVDPYVSSVRAAEMVALGALYFIVAHVRWRSGELMAIASFSLIALGLVSCYGIYQHYVSLPATARAISLQARYLDPLTRTLMRIQIESGRAFSTFRYPNGFAGYIGLVWPLSVVCAALAGRRAGRRAAAVVGGLGFLALLLTFSRGGILAALLGGAVLIVWLIGTPGLRRHVVLPSTLLLVLLCGVGLFLTGREVWRAPQSDEASVTPSRVVEASGYRSAMREKVLTWEGGLRALGERPFLGHGPGTFRDVYLRWKPAGSHDEARHAHNHYLELAVGIGIPGALAFLIVVAGSLVRLLSGMPRAGRPSDNGECAARRWGMGAAIFAGLVGLLLHIFIDWDMENVGVAYTVWLLLGLAAGWGLVPSEEESRPVRSKWRWGAEIAALSIAVLFLGVVAGQWRADALDRGAAGLVAEGDSEGAIFLAVRAVTIAPRSAAAHMTLGDAYAARALEAGGREWSSRAEAEYRRAAELTPRSPFPLARLGRFLLDWQAEGHEADPAEAVEVVSAALDRYPASWWLLRDLGYAHLSAGELEAAQGALERSLLLRNDVEVMYALGRVREARGLRDEARSTYQALHEIDPAYADVSERLDALSP
jgi:O-antigen ligase/Flp pilus assembly protein TadD